MKKGEFIAYVGGVARRTGLNIAHRRNCLNWIEIHVFTERKHWQICVKNYREACLLLDTIEKTVELLQEVN